MSAIEQTMSAGPQRSMGENARLYMDIARPKVMALVVFTGLPALALGLPEWPSLTKALWVMAGTAMAGGASSAINAYLERDFDALMARTRNRPLPASSVLPKTVLLYGVLLTVLSTIVLWYIGGPLAAGVGLTTIAFYVGIYTMWLKPRTPQNIVIGGAAGATAPLIAAAAATGELTPGAWILFAIIFLWTPPHFWAVGIFRREEYKAAGFPMMPLVVGDQPTRWRSLAYTLAMIPVTLAPYFLGYVGLLYLVGAVALNAWFLWVLIASMRAQSKAADWKVFKVSIGYLTFLFLVMLVDLAAFGPQ